jgi:hypothetical protein
MHLCRQSVNWLATDIYFLLFMRAIWRQNLKLIISSAYVNFCSFITDVHDEGDTTPEYQPPEIPDMDIKPMMKGKEDFRSVLTPEQCFSDPDPDPDWIWIPGRPKLSLKRGGKRENFMFGQRPVELEVTPRA